MIKRTFLTALLVLASSLASLADEQKKISINNDDHKSETVNLGYCNIFVSLTDVDESDNAEITIELENIHESNTLLLFERAYDEKTLKKMSPSIRYDKVFGGSKGKRYIDVCPDLKFTNKIKSSEKTKLFVKTGVGDAPLICKLPIYIAKEKHGLFTGHRMYLLAKDVIELEIQAQLKPDEEYISVENAYNVLRKDIDSEHFCTNRNHKGASLKSLKKKYEGKITDLKRHIISIIGKRFESGKSISKFKEIVAKLDEISLDAKTVPSCPYDFLHKCKNCSLTYEAIYKQIENYYIDIHNGKKTKAQVLSEVEALYTCVSKNTKRTANDGIKSRITTYYNKIKSL